MASDRKPKLTARLLNAIVSMSAIASANGQEGDYQDADMEAMDRAGDWAGWVLYERQQESKRRKQESKRRKQGQEKDS